MLFDGVDHPLRATTAAGLVYFELDLAGNVRRLRGAGGADLGGYRYTAFGKTLEDTATVQQSLRWKGRSRDVVSGVEVYDMRARWWVPELGAFLSVDEYDFHDRRSTLWGWPRQNPYRWSDPSGRSGWPTTFQDFVFDLEATGTLDDTEAFTLGVLDHIPALPFMVNGPSIADAFGAVGIKGKPCSKTAAVAGQVAGGLLTGAAGAEKEIAHRLASRALGRALERAGHVRPPNSAAHHIVAKGARAAEPARQVLDAFKIGLHEAENGVFLNNGFHQGVHTKAYYEAVNEALSNAATREEAVTILRDIGRSLVEGGFP